MHCCQEGDMGIATKGNRSMAEPSKLFDDIAKMAQGALGAANSARQEAEASMRAWFERQVAEMDFVPREDFDTVAEMAQLAREENDLLKTRLDALEKDVAALQKKPRAAPKKAPAAQGAD